MNVYHLCVASYGVMTISGLQKIIKQNKYDHPLIFVIGTSVVNEPPKSRYLKKQQKQKCLKNFLFFRNVYVFVFSKSERCFIVFFMNKLGLSQTDLKGCTFSKKATVA